MATTGAAILLYFHSHFHNRTYFHILATVGRVTHVMMAKLKCLSEVYEQTSELGYQFGHHHI